MPTTINPSDQTITQYTVQVGGASNTLGGVGPGLAGQMFQSAGNATPPVYSTATYPSTATGTGKILRADGTNFSATTATFPDTAGISGNVLTSNGTNWASAAPATSGTVTSVSGTTNQVSVATGTTTPVISLVGPYTPSTYTSHGVLLGAGTSSIVALAEAPTGTVLTGVTGANAAFSATPTVTSISFGATALNAYQEGTWTPAFGFSTSSAGVTYTNQLGQYVKIGKLVFISGRITLSSKGTASGTVTITGLPFTSSISTTTQQIFIDIRTGLTLTVLYTEALLEIPTASTVSNTAQIGSNQTKSALTDAMLSNTTDITFSGCYTSV